MSSPNKYGSQFAKALQVREATPDGADYITDTEGHATAKGWCEIEAVQAAVAAIVAPNVSGDLSAVVLPVGFKFRGNISSFKLASGKVYATRAS